MLIVDLVGVVCEFRRLTLGEGSHNCLSEPRSQAEMLPREENPI